MTLSLNYPASFPDRRNSDDAPRFWLIANMLRRQVFPQEPDQPLEASDMPKLLPGIVVNGKAIEIAWDFQHQVHDAGGLEVYGVCETDPEVPRTANVCINGPLLHARPDIMLSTAAHELGHVVFDIPEALDGGGAAYRQYRSAEAADNAFRNAVAISFSEWRANEFMGALLAPALAVHRRMLHHARNERLAIIRSRSAGHPAWPVVSGDNDPDAVAGITEVLAQEFGVSPRFMSVRLDQYKLVTRRNRKGGRS
jgi:hypothetical protein